MIEGKAGFTALIDVIRDEGHSVKTLTKTDLERMVGEKYRILRERTGNVETAQALIVKNRSNENICLVFSVVFRWYQPIIMRASIVWHFSMNGCTVSTN